MNVIFHLNRFFYIYFIICLYVAGSFFSLHVHIAKLYFDPVKVYSDLSMTIISGFSDFRTNIGYCGSLRIQCQTAPLSTWTTLTAAGTQT